MNILGCFCKKLKPIFEVITQLVPLAIAIISLILAIYILANMKEFDNKARTSIRAHCTAGLSEDPTQQPENEYNNEIYGYLNEELLSKEDLKSIDNQLKSSTLSEFIKDHLSSESGATKHIHSSSFIELQKIQMNENNNNDQSIFSLEESQIADNIQIKNVDSGSDKCINFIPNIKSVYGCNVDNITVSGREQVCSDPLEATVEKMSNFADVVNKIMVFAFFMIVIYVIIALFFTRISEYLLKIWHDAKEQTKKSTENEETQEDKENPSNKEKEKEMKEKSIENENKW
ncbi:MAG: hypothetical protein EZS28_048852 [Streblomastix strix]|uniref:Uncharacterized protein n=1 Tax=Streblomastix strix TaxID=222440 RepID=A0A5J4TDB3_9EUKA|nr:MAG: hypothetical protein EZS28_048852 [Streblomastix strix]